MNIEKIKAPKCVVISIVNFAGEKKPSKGVGFVKQIGRDVDREFFKSIKSYNKPVFFLESMSVEIGDGLFLVPEFAVLGYEVVNEDEML